MNRKELPRLLILLGLATIVTPGPQSRRRVNPEDHDNIRPCKLMDFTSAAFCIQNDFRLTCRFGITTEWTKGSNFEITELRVEEWPGECFNIGRLPLRFPELRQLEFINCTKLNTFKGHLDEKSKVVTIAMHGLTSLWEVPAEMVASMQELEEMDLRNNVLRHMKARLLRGPPKLKRVFLSDNKWDCSDGGLDWLALERDNGTVKKKIEDYYQLMCHQQLYRGKPLHKIMDIIRTMRQTCPEPCTCAMTHVVSDRAGGVIPLITVNCSQKALHEPPEALPPSTTTLRLEGNKVTCYCSPMLDVGLPQIKAKPIVTTLSRRVGDRSICTDCVVFTGSAAAHLSEKPLVAFYDTHGQIWSDAISTLPINTIRSIIQNSNYHKLMDLYLDNNSISAIKEIEGSEWFTAFRVLSLRGNMLKQIPVYAFDKAMQGNNNIMHLFLGHNPWRCDCFFVPRFQTLLLKYKRVIRDLPDIRCSKSDDKTISLAQISTMPLGHVCRSGVEMPVSTINIINITLSALIILVIGRFIYDWHSFKTTGRLPWISSILP